MAHSFSDEAIIESLADYAVSEQPRLFALYGIYKTTGTPYCNWGIEWPDERAIMLDRTASSTWISESAEKLLHRHEIFGDARLCWLDDIDDDHEVS